MNLNAFVIMSCVLGYGLWFMCYVLQFNDYDSVVNIGILYGVSADVNCNQKLL